MFLFLATHKVNYLYGRYLHRALVAAESEKEAIELLTELRPDNIVVHRDRITLITLANKVPDDVMELAENDYDNGKIFMLEIGQDDDEPPSPLSEIPEEAEKLERELEEGGDDEDEG